MHIVLMFNYQLFFFEMRIQEAYLQSSKHTVSVRSYVLYRLYCFANLLSFKKKKIIHWESHFLMSIFFIFFLRFPSKITRNDIFIDLQHLFFNIFKEKFNQTCANACNSLNFLTTFYKNIVCRINFTRYMLLVHLSYNYARNFFFF